MSGSEFDFEPNAARARLLDERMRFDLGESLTYLAQEMRPHVALDEETFARFLSDLKCGPASSLTFARYGEIVQAIEADNLEEARRLLDCLVQGKVPAPGLHILPLGDPAQDPGAELYIRYVDNDPEMPMFLGPPLAEDAANAEKQIRAALTLLHQADPDLAGEIDELLREIVLCAGRPNAKGFTFDGASSFLLWGAVLINAGQRGDRFEIALMLAHESAHNLLFGLCPREPLLTNDPGERHASPLRRDPRPLEGIYHATYVSARMSRTAARHLTSGVLSPAETAPAQEAAVKYRHAFLDGYEVLRQHAHLTSSGEAILSSAYHSVA